MSTEFTDKSTFFVELGLGDTFTESSGLKGNPDRTARRLKVVGTRRDELYAIDTTDQEGSLIHYIGVIIEGGIVVLPRHSNLPNGIEITISN